MQLNSKDKHGIGSRAACATLIVLCALTANTASATRYAGEPYYLGVGGRALGRGSAFVAATPDASSPFWNMASITQLEGLEVILQHSETFGSLLNHDFIGVAMPAADPGGWSWGGYLTHLGGSGIQLTVFDSTTGRPLVDREAGHADWSLVFGVARRGGSWWSWSVAAKTVIRKLPGGAEIESNSAWGLGLDVSWWGQWQEARFGVKVADVTTTFLSYDSGRQETISPHVNWGAEWDLPDWVEDLTATVAGEAETYFEGRKTGAQYWSGPISVDLHLGVELGYKDLLFGRAGSDKGALSLGTGFRFGRWALDAALTDHEFLDNTYHVSLRHFWR